MIQTLLPFFGKIRDFTFIILLLFCTLKTYSQCNGTAGNDNVALDICNISDPASRNIDLNLELGLHVGGGVWRDEDRSGGLNRTTGILNAQVIRRSGTYRYSYTVTNASGCSDTAVVTVRIGGYTGVPGANTSVCNNENRYNLFEAFNGDFLPPQIGGTWVGNTTNAGLNNNFLNTSVLVPGTTYEYTYSIPAIGSCPAPADVKVFVTIFRSPRPGTGGEIKLCSDQLNLYTDYNLFDGIVGEDEGGFWREIGTDELDDNDATDSRINIQRIFNTRGPGVYEFNYTAISENNVCSDQTSYLSFVIEKKLDFTGATLTVNAPICESDLTATTFSGTISNVTDIPNGLYNVTYTISGNNTLFSTTQNFSNNVFTFPIAQSNFTANGRYTVTINSIISTTNLGICQNNIPPLAAEIVINAIPQINGANLQVSDVCQSTDAAVILSGPFNLADGDYRITYALSGSNSVSNQNLIITLQSGAASFMIPGLQLSASGATIFTISRVTNLVTNCSQDTNKSASFLVKAIPNAATVTLSANAVCQGQPIIVQFSGLGTMATAAISYRLSGANTATSQTANLTINAGQASFIVPSNLIANTGTTVFNLDTLTDLNTTCSAQFSSKTVNLVVNDLPVLPAVNAQSFCKIQNTTIANLIPNGPQFRWYASASATTALPSTTVLQTTTYFVKAVNSATTCESDLAAVSVVINELQTPVLEVDGEKFCGLENPTILKLSQRVSNNGVLVWYDAEVSGNLLSDATLLQDKGVYFGFDSASTNNCLSTIPLKVTVSLTNCDVTPDFFIPDGFSPNGDGVNDTFSIPDIEFIYPNYVLEIYNRYGSLMYTANKDKPKWDGASTDARSSANGRATEGVYFYVIHFNKGGIAPKQGRLYLNR